MKRLVVFLAVIMFGFLSCKRADPRDRGFTESDIVEYRKDSIQFDSLLSVRNELNEFLIGFHTRHADAKMVNSIIETSADSLRNSHNRLFLLVENNFGENDIAWICMKWNRDSSIVNTDWKTVITDTSSDLTLVMADSVFSDSLFVMYDSQNMVSSDSLRLYYQIQNKRRLVMSQLDFLRETWVGALK